MGSIFCNAMNTDMKQELLWQEEMLVSEVSLNSSVFEELFLRIAPKRLFMLMVLFLISVSIYAPVLFMLVTGYFGFSAAVFVCSVTMSAGVWGILDCAILLFPQIIFYILVAYIVVWWMPTEGKQLNGGSALILTVMTLAGVVVESLINPWVLTFL